MRAIDELATEICTLAGHINAANGRWLTLIAEFDRRQGVSLCRFHHRAVHEEGFSIQVLDDGALRFLKPDGKPVDRVFPGSAQPPGDWRQTPAATEVSRYQGERMDYGIALDVSYQQARRVKNVPAGTSAE